MKTLKDFSSRVIFLLTLYHILFNLQLVYYEYKVRSSLYAKSEEISLPHDQALFLDEIA